MLIRLFGIDIIPPSLASSNTMRLRNEVEKDDGYSHTCGRHLDFRL